MARGEEEVMMKLGYGGVLGIYMNVGYTNGIYGLGVCLGMGRAYGIFRIQDLYHGRLLPVVLSKLQIVRSTGKFDLKN